ncbi:MAG TPA: PIN domain-containing protein [Vicinamibacterales bacterium]|nr:PIN domain-containing protein [Vicinamibacterales bacterium]
MARKTEAYVDTAALIAFLDRSDSHHPHFRRLFSDPPKLSTSALVIAEGHGWFLRRYDQRRAIEFLNFIDSLSVLTVVAFDTDSLHRSADLVRKYGDQRLTLADAHGLAVMASKKISICWSSDRHLTLGGATLAI